MSLKEFLAQQAAKAPPKTESPLADSLALQNTLRKSPRSVPEIRRICDIPIKFPLTEEEVQAVNDMHVKRDAPLDFKLQRVQAEALYDYENDQMFGPIEVGGGKTLISLRIVAMAYERGMQKIVLMVPPQVVDQLVNHDIAWCRKRVPLGCSFHVLAGKDRETRLAMTRHNARGCFILPYSLLSREDGSALLENIRPQLLVFDEAHQLKNRKTARTRRIIQYVRKHDPQVVAMSGTMTSRSIKDYAHIMQMCLGKGSPLPLDAQTVGDWSGILDSSQNGFDDTRRTGTGPLRPLVHWNNSHFPEDHCEYTQEGFRRAYQNRLLTCPGVVSSPADSLGCSLLIANDRVKTEGRPGADLLKQLVDNVIEKWIAPNGDEIEYAIHKFAALYELSAGFYNNRYWPTTARIAAKHGCSEEEAEKLLERAKDHHVALQSYHRELRSWLNYHQVAGCDTPMLVAREINQHGTRIVTRQLYDAYMYAKSLHTPDLPEREKEPVRVCDYKIQAAIRWMKQRKRGIIWYVHNGMGRWLFEAAREHGLNVRWCPAGAASNKFLTAPEAPKLTKDMFLICTLRAHGLGKNLQYMNDALFLQFPRPEDQAQQTIGRTHRPGQLEDEVYFTTLVSTQTDEISLAATLNDSIYNFETMRSPRKLLFANWNPMPVIYGYDILERAGTEAKKLNAKQRKMLEDKFQKAT